MKEALSQYIDIRNNKISQNNSTSQLNGSSDPLDTKLKAIFVGIRRTDPYGQHLKHFQKTDKGWPDFIRIHPVIDWRYKDIWNFLRVLGIPYCILYELGYTSLGGTDNTVPNPDLRREGSFSHLEPKPQSLNELLENHRIVFKPAHRLEDELHEREGRA